MPHIDRLKDFKRFPLAHLPTPLAPLERLSAQLGGPRLMIKRDDCTGLAFGGNKTRKLEFLVADALAQGANRLVTEGGLQSNSVRQTVAAAVRAGLKCTLVLDENVDWREPAYRQSGNLMLDRLLGADIVFCEKGTPRADVFPGVMEDLRRAGEKPYFIPTGGSNAIGGLGYAQCAFELMDQAAAANITIDHVVLATGSGGSQGGFLAGLRAARSAMRCHGIDIDNDVPGVRAAVVAIAAETGAMLGVTDPDDSDVVIHDGYAAPAYGLPNDAMRAAVKLLARTEAILLDPVYSGKGMAGMLGLIEQGAFAADETVVFIHTGGAPTLFGYTSLFQ